MWGELAVILGEECNQNFDVLSVFKMLHGYLRNSTEKEYRSQQSIVFFLHDVSVPACAQTVSTQSREDTDSQRGLPCASSLGARLRRGRGN